MKSRQFIALTLCVLVANLGFAAENRTTGYTVKYSGGSLPTVKGGDDLKLFVDSEKLRLLQNKTDTLNIPVGAITELSYGQEVHRRIGTAAGLAIVSFGIGALVAFSKSKKHYIGIVWDAGDGKRGGIAFQADKNEYRGLIAALEGVSGKKAVDTDAVTDAAAKTGLSQVVRAPTVPTPVAQTASSQAETPRVIPTTVPSVLPNTTNPVPARTEPVRGTPAVAASIPIASQQAEPVRVLSAVQPGALKTVTAPAPINPVDVTFASNPPGAMVFFNGTAFTRTPFVTKLMPGTYTVQMQLAGFPDWSSGITIEAAKPSTFVAQLNSTTGVVLK